MKTKEEIKQMIKSVEELKKFYGIYDKEGAGLYALRWVLDEKEE